MNVSGVNPSAGVYAYNSIRLNELRNQMIMASKESQTQPEVAEAIQPEQAPLLRDQTYTSYDFAQEYRAGETYDLKGVDADIYKLDVEKAVSDMAKDQILQQYQYFVGSSSYENAKANAAEMALYSGENFIL